MKLSFRLLNVVAVLLAPAGLVAQSDRVIRGTVLSSEDGTGLDGAVVRTIEVAPARTLSDPSGRFALRAAAGEVRLAVARIGFAPDTALVRAGMNELVIRLTPAALEIEPNIVQADPAFTTASSSVIRALDIQLRPRESSQQLLALTPGLVIAQHAGGGKAEQIFLRGFDADHGTDVAVSVDGSPVNMVTHAHGQGYADLHFVLPEVVERVEVRKGPYAAEDGDLATAGAVAFITKDRMSAQAEVRGGSLGTGRFLAVAPFGGDATTSGGYLAGAYQYTEGPFEQPQGYSRYNLFGKWTTQLGRARLSVSASGTDASWDASGQVPERSVAAGDIDRFGSIDPTEGGTTHRYDASVALNGLSSSDTRWQARLYAAKYFLRLFSNFTFFLNDPVNGDGIEQRDDRWIFGGEGTLDRPLTIGGVPGRLGAGVELRADAADVGLYTQRQRDRLGTTTASRINQQHAGVWLQQDLYLSPSLRLRLGLRGDLFHFGVGALDGAPSPAGQRTLGRISPKVSLAYDISSTTTLFANTGAGFHSNDARDVISAAPGDRALPGALGAEIGVRHGWRRGSVAVTAWALDLQSELVYVGDEGVTEPSGRSRRMGLDAEARVQLLPWLWADADLNLSRGRFKDEPDGADYVPLAPTVTSTGGLTVRDLGKVGGGIRYRHIGTRAADETNSIKAKGYTVTELFGSWQIGGARLVAAIDNVFKAEWNEAQFATTSQLQNEVAPVTELHFTPGGPRSVIVGVEYGF